MFGDRLENLAICSEQITHNQEGAWEGLTSGICVSLSTILVNAMKDFLSRFNHTPTPSIAPPASWNNK